MTPKIFVDERAYREALRELSVLVETDPALGTPEGDRLDMLSTLVAAYEARLCGNLKECSTS